MQTCALRSSPYLKVIMPHSSLNLVLFNNGMEMIEVFSLWCSNHHYNFVVVRMVSIVHNNYIPASRCSSYVCISTPLLSYYLHSTLISQNPSLNTYNKRFWWHLLFFIVLGKEANIGVEGHREPYTPCTDPSFCNDICNRDGYGGGTCRGGHCECII